MLTIFITQFFIISEARAKYDIRNSIVKIYTQKISPYYSDPWSMSSPDSHTGSGCIISNKYILTNAHVVADNTLIQVRKYGQAKKYTAEPLFISYDVDLAVLTIKNKDFFNNIQPLQVGPLPKTQAEVLVYGFPKGGDTLSITKGVISRIEHETYAQSSLKFLASQIDAPINPGNSGGPAIVDKKIVGIIMQSLARSENIGYMVPTPIIKHFLKDISDGSLDGFPALGIYTQDIENPDLKKKYGMKEGQTGILVTKTVPGSPSDGEINEKDILLSVEGHKISGNGTVVFRKKERTNFSYFIQNHQIGEDIDLEILRNGKKLNLILNLNKPIQHNQLVKIQYGVLPTYYIFGGLVFAPLTLNYLKDWGTNWYRKAPSELVSILNANVKSKEDEEVVVLIRVLASEINYGYHDYENWIVNKVNGKEIRNLKELVEIIENSSDEFVTFENKLGREIVINNKKAKEFKDSILKTYHIKRDRSQDLTS